MTTESRTIRIFVSSTFSDFVQERDALQRQVFPALKQMCHSQGWNFVIIDLRWGISGAAAHEQLAIEICRQEIARCQQLSPRPSFLALVGDRYGWCPLPTAIPVEEFVLIKQNVPGPEDIDLICRWYRMDRNAVPPMWVLQPRDGRYIDDSNWSLEVELPLHRLLNEAALASGISGPELDKYVVSATEQEIIDGVLNTPEAGKSAVAAFRTIKCDVADIPSEMLDVDEVGMQIPEKAARVRALKTRVADKLDERNIYRYEIESGPTIPATTYIDAFCDGIRSRLEHIIRTRMDEYDALHDSFDEGAAHARFAEGHREVFVGRDMELDLVRRYLSHPAQRSLTLTGTSGSGKTALMAQIETRAVSWFPKAIVFARYVGATSSSRNLSYLLRALCRELEPDASHEDEPPLENFSQFITFFFDRLRSASEHVQVIVIIDCLDRIVEGPVSRLLVEPPSGAHLLLSFTPDVAPYHGTEPADPVSHIALEKLPKEDGHQLVERRLTAMGRTLQPAQFDYILGQFQHSGSPLYLQIVAQFARKWRSYEQTPILEPGIPALIQQFLGELTEPKAFGLHLVSRLMGLIRASRFGLSEDELLALLGADDVYMATLREQAFFDLPSGPDDVPKIPEAVWARLRHALDPYLVERDVDGTVLMNFYHEQFELVVESMFLSEDEKRGRHEALSQFFSGDNNSGTSSRSWSQRSLMELPFQQRQAELWQELTATLTDFGFVAAKCEHNALADLIQDYKRASGTPSARSISDWAEFLRSHQHLIDSRVPFWPKRRILAQIANEQSRYERIKSAGMDFVAGEQWVRLQSRTSREFAFEHVLLTAGPVRGVLKLHDTLAISWSDNADPIVWDLKTCSEKIRLVGHDAPVVGVIAANEHRIITWAEDGILVAWNLPDATIWKSFSIHHSTIGGAILAGDGKLIFWSGDGEVIAWDFESSEHIVIESQGFPVQSLEMLSADRIVIIFDHCQKILQLKTLHSTTLPGFAGQTKQRLLRIAKDAFFQWSPERVGFINIEDDKTETIWSTSSDLPGTEIAGVLSLGPEVFATWEIVVKDVDVWRVDRGVLYKAGRLEGHTRPVLGAMKLRPNVILTWSKDNTLRIWHLKTMKHQESNVLDNVEVRDCVVLMGHESTITGVLVVGTGRIISWATDGSVHLWDETNGDLIATFTAHSSGVSGIMEIDANRIVTWSEYDSHVLTWNLRELENASSSSSPKSMPIDACVLANGTVLSIHDSGAVWIWTNDTISGQRVASPVSIDVKTVQLFGENKALLSTWDGHLFIVETGKTIAIREVLGRAHFTEDYIVVDEDSFVTWSVNGEILKWTGSRPFLQKTLVNSDASTSRILLGHGGTVASWSKEQEILLWSKSNEQSALARGRRWLNDRFRPSLNAGTEPTHYLRGHSDSVEGLLFLPDGRLLSWSRDTTLRLWDHTNGKTVASFTGHKSWVLGAAVMPDLNIASWSDDGSIMIWNGLSGEKILEVHHHEKGVSGVFACSQNEVLSFGVDGCLCVWEYPSGDKILQLEIDGTPVRGALSLDDCRVFAWTDFHFILTTRDGHYRIFPASTKNWEMAMHISNGKGQHLYCTSRGDLTLWRNGNPTVPQHMFDFDFKIDLVSLLRRQPQTILSDGSWLIDVESDNTLRYDVATGNLQQFAGVWRDDDNDDQPGLFNGESSAFALVTGYEKQVISFIYTGKEGADGFDTVVWSSEQDVVRICGIYPGGTVSVALADGTFQFIEFFKGGSRTPLE